MKLTIERVKELALKNHNKGGDGIYECFSDEMIQNLIDNGVNTEKKLLNFFKEEHEIDEEHRKAALYYAYGTTNEEEIKRMLEAETEFETEEHEEYIDDYVDDPCFGCYARDNSYNCKHCPHGDDGRYESPFDVYTPSELGLNVKW